MDTVHRFLFEALDIRGVLVQLGPAWQAMHARREYPQAVRALLGEMAAVTTLMGSNLKTPGRLSFQLQGNGQVSMLVVDCDEQLRLRGMARSQSDGGNGGEARNSQSTSLRSHSGSAVQSRDSKDGVATPRSGVQGMQSQPAPTDKIIDLVGDGQLVLTLQTDGADPYQSYVPIEGDSLAQIFEHYLALSDQQPARLWLMANEKMACGLLLQKLPNADACDADGWTRVETLANTVTDAELGLPPEDLLTRLFGEEVVRLFAPRYAAWHCPRNEEKVRNVLLSLGREELESMLEKADIIEVDDEICGHEYRFGPEILNELFPPEGRVLH
ncbi:MAG: Hsp33 family molecular chaperone HslO [Rhodocyclaceae bacterium]|nr:Hsp33 family molecular chaperone HslO [Rhodocyclaceae bacterium]MBL0076499.1 Hsp33 family molecular chaperone HslO [Rhodocyclaceae bacterium]MBP6109623.1 Hsp33 family molecular chaperone HslO [Rhodocyclaceae bacterium]MBP6278905.1 Hsp33 family molecular chaperone HslO [Rhodocyclaceae bacterium]